MEKLKEKRHSGFTSAFAGRKGGVYNCDMCGKKTRDTGENGSVNLCPICYKECIEENVRSDFGEERLAEMKRNGDLK